MITKKLGYQGVELAGLVAAGAVYGTVNGFAARIPGLGQVQRAVNVVPGLGNAILPMAAGALLNHFAERSRNEYMSSLGRGLVAASMVGMGVSLSTRVGVLRPSTLGAIDYTLDGYGDADFGAIDYTPELSGYGYYGDADQMGAIDYTPELAGYGSYGDADFGGIGEDADFGEEADFGDVPEGLMSGEGQMG